MMGVDQKGKNGHLGDAKKKGTKIESWYQNVSLYSIGRKKCEVLRQSFRFQNKTNGITPRRWLLLIGWFRHFSWLGFKIRRTGLLLAAGCCSAIPDCPIWFPRRSGKTGWLSWTISPCSLLSSKTRASCWLENEDWIAAYSNKKTRPIRPMMRPWTY